MLLGRTRRQMLSDQCMGCFSVAGIFALRYTITILAVGLHRLTISQKNPYLVNSKEEVMSWSLEVQRIMGYNVSGPNIGSIDFIQSKDFVSENHNLDRLESADQSQKPVSNP